MMPTLYEPACALPCRSEPAVPAAVVMSSAIAQSATTDFRRRRCIRSLPTSGKLRPDSGLVIYRSCRRRCQGVRSSSVGDLRRPNATEVAGTCALRPRRLRQEALRARVLLGCARLELVADERLVAGDPGVVAGLDHVRGAGAEVDLGAVVVDDVHLPALDDPDVPHLAAVGAHDRLDALR